MHLRLIYCCHGNGFSLTWIISWNIYPTWQIIDQHLNCLIQCLLTGTSFNYTCAEGGVGNRSETLSSPRTNINDTVVLLCFVWNPITKPILHHSYRSYGLLWVTMYTHKFIHSFTLPICVGPMTRFTWGRFSQGIKSCGCKKGCPPFLCEPAWCTITVTRTCQQTSTRAHTDNNTNLTWSCAHLRRKRERNEDHNTNIYAASLSRITLCIIIAAHIQSSSCNSNNHVDPCSKHTHVHTSIAQTLEQTASQAYGMMYYRWKQVQVCVCVWYVWVAKERLGGGWSVWC